MAIIKGKKCKRHRYRATQWEIAVLDKYDGNYAYCLECGKQRSETKHNSS